MNKDKLQVGGGVKKILYALNTIQRIGLLDSKKALTANNACKACGLGMGGQRGGMTNEQDEYPAVCNKSIQAQSTDIQPPIPEAIFDYSLDDFRALSAHELEHLGRLGNPIFKAKDQNKFSVVTWEWALQHAIKRFSEIEAARSFFYSSGRSSNEAGFVFQLFARLFGTNNVNNCSYYCHQATSVGLSSTIGTGTATVELADLDRADLVFVIGANPASNHPRFIHKLKACRDRGGQVVIINPAKEPGLVKFALPKSPRSLLSGGSDIASHYLQPNIGSDRQVFQGLAKATIELSAADDSFISDHAQGFQTYKRSIEAVSWQEIEKSTGLGYAEICSIAKVYQQSKNAVFAWGMGITHHQHGVENVEHIANLTLLRGMLGRPGAGVLPLRGHSNVQGIGTIGVKPVLADDVFDKLQSELNVDLSNAPQGLDTLACLEAAERGEIDAALIMGGNLYSATPNTEWAKRAMETIGFKLFLTTTLNAGHINACDHNESLILPVTARDEEPEATTQESMFNFVRLSDGGITRIANARSEVSVLVDLASAIVPKASNDQFDIRSFASHKNIRQAIAKIVPGMQQLKDIDVAKQEFHIQNRLMHTPEFRTPSGKAQFITHQQIPPQSVAAHNRYPFMLTSVRSEGQFNSIIYEEHDSYRGVEQRWTVMMNADDMRDLALTDNSVVDIHSKHGKMLAVQVKEFDLPRGNVMVYYPEANTLIGLERDARSQTPAFKSVPVSIKPS